MTVKEPKVEMNTVKWAYWLQYFTYRTHT